MVEEGDLIWTLMVSYLMQKDTDDDKKIDDRGEDEVRPTLGWKCPG